MQGGSLSPFFSIKSGDACALTFVSGEKNGNYHR
jgi:hypothetical protein